MAEAREDAGAIDGGGLVVVRRQASKRGDVDERGHARPGPDARQDAAGHRPRRILQPCMARDAEHRKHLVQHSVLGGVVHHLPKQRDHKRARQVRQEVHHAEEHLALRNLGEQEREEDRSGEADHDGERHVLEGASPCLPERGVGGDADEVVQPGPRLGADDLVVLERHHRALDERIVAPQRNAQDGRREKQPRKKRAG